VRSRTVCEELYAADVEAAVFTVIDEAGDCELQVAVCGSAAHKVEAVLGKALVSVR
jgi:hypothetical protein